MDVGGRCGLGMQPFTFLLLHLVLAISSVLSAIGPSTRLTLTSKTVSPDGSMVYRDAIVFEESSSVIGPLIVGHKGDRFEINVVNNLDNDKMRKSTSIHWHGVLQSGGRQSWADGAAFVTQCPIAGKGHSFKYQFVEPEQAGTFWYHSHLSTQYCDGARGPFVIYDSQDPHSSFYDVDDESTVITIADWYHVYAMQFDLAQVESTLINGLGRWPGREGITTNISVISVEQGKRYLLRFVNIACTPWYRVNIDGHTDLKIIEADGVNTVPVIVDGKQIFINQKYSVVLNANQSVDNYWIRTSHFGNSSFEGGFDSAILRYVGALPVEPRTTPNIVSNLLRERSLVPLVNAGAPGPPIRGGPGVKVLSLHSPYLTRTFCTSASMPVLLQILSGKATAKTLLPAGSFVEVNKGDIVEVRLSVPDIATIDGPHPFHMHGHTFDIIRSAGEAEDNFVNPPRRDVVNSGDANDNVTIRFVADNSGPWFLHCHVDWHLEMGLAIWLHLSQVVFAESVDAWNTTIAPPSQWNELCSIY
ncbi:laccase, partial [Flagelloscypha sp. PMI_526]